jgi:hypothetical protein
MTTFSQPGPQVVDAARPRMDKIISVCGSLRAYGVARWCFR